MPLGFANVCLISPRTSKRKLICCFVTEYKKDVKAPCSSQRRDYLGLSFVNRKYVTNLANIWKMTLEESQRKREELGYVLYQWFKKVLFRSEKSYTDQVTEAEEGKELEWRDEKGTTRTMKNSQKRVKSVPIIIEGLNKTFRDGNENYVALKDINLRLEAGSLVALVGPSGSGKSTLLRIIAGLETSDSGRILLGDEDATNIRVQDRKIGFVFQHYALFRHMTVEENIEFGLKIRKVNKKTRKKKVEELLDLMQLSGLGHRYPSQISGGQRQRVALARSLAPEPSVLLLDEPFGALDAKVRRGLRAWLRRLHEEVGVTTVFVTHDQAEALEVASLLVVMNRGRIEQVGTPSEVYDNPQTPFVMSFMGEVNVLKRTRAMEENALLQLGNTQSFPIQKDSESFMFRPHDIQIELAPSARSTEARVQTVVFLGWQVNVDVELSDGQILQAHLTKAAFEKLRLYRGQTVYIRFPENNVYQVGDDYII